jgi:hypothetical protein
MRPRSADAMNRRRAWRWHHHVSPYARQHATGADAAPRGLCVRRRTARCATARLGVGLLFDELLDVVEDGPEQRPLRHGFLQPRPCGSAHSFRCPPAPYDLYDTRATAPPARPPAAEAMRIAPSFRCPPAPYDPYGTRATAPPARRIWHGNTRQRLPRPRPAHRTRAGRSLRRCHRLSRCIGALWSGSELGSSHVGVSTRAECGCARPRSCAQATARARV